jgi:hypothetical protein
MQGQKNIYKIVFRVSLQLFSGTSFIVRRIQRAMIKMYIDIDIDIEIDIEIDIPVKFPLFFFEFTGTLIFSTDFRKYSNIKFREIPSLWADRRT